MYDLIYTGQLTSNKVFPTSLGRNSKLAPVRRGQGGAEERCRLAGGSVNKQGNLNMRLASGYHKISRSPHPPARTLKVHREALTGFSHKPSHGLNNPLFSQVASLKEFWLWEWLAECTFHRQGRGWRASSCPRSAHSQLQVMSSRWPPPTTQYSIKAKSVHAFVTGMMKTTLQECYLIFVFPV